MAHITGGGLLESCARACCRKHRGRNPEGRLAASQAVRTGCSREGNYVAEKEMHRTFNCGIGLVIVVAAADAEAAMAELKAQGEAVYNIGVISGPPG